VDSLVTALLAGYLPDSTVYATRDHVLSNYAAMADSTSWLFTGARFNASVSGTASYVPLYGTGGHVLGNSWMAQQSSRGVTILSTGGYANGLRIGISFAGETPYPLWIDHTDSVKGLSGYTYGIKNEPGFGGNTTVRGYGFYNRIYTMGHGVTIPELIGAYFNGSTSISGSDSIGTEWGIVIGPITRGTRNVALETHEGEVSLGGPVSLGSTLTMTATTIDSFAVRSGNLCFKVGSTWYKAIPE